MRPLNSLQNNTHFIILNSNISTLTWEELEEQGISFQCDSRPFCIFADTRIIVYNGHSEIGLVLAGH